MLGLTQSSEATVAHDDRRMFSRRPAYGTIDAIITTDHEPIHVELRDLSVGGVGGLMNRAVSRGASVMLSFPPEGFSRGFNTRGKVVRCEPSATGYRVGIQFDRLLGT